ncbi:hypothetical protein KQX54_015630 [Cotesia glomerata]|uniref:Uncharacterized protein n=1 Tax=Cotesia glomerata TaxID=32391 RepID=A0AAV7ING1_COTGL|nr:hypothetical protein KQX54_015630 [Cotesia glomerata]
MASTCREIYSIDIRIKFPSGFPGLLNLVNESLQTSDQISARNNFNLQVKSRAIFNCIFLERPMDCSNFSSAAVPSFLFFFGSKNRVLDPRPLPGEKIAVWGRMQTTMGEFENFFSDNNSNNNL